MGAFLDLPAGNAALKEFYDEQKVENLAYDDNPALVMVPKKTDATGKYVPIPIIYETSQGSSNTFTNAQGNQSPALLAEFMVPLRPDYGIATLGNQAMEASGDNTGSFLDFATLIVDVAIQGAANRVASAQFRSGTGSIGTLNAAPVAGVITLTNAADVVQFGINQTLQASSTDGGAPRAALGWVVARNVSAGTITVSATAMGGAAGNPAGWTTGDFLLVQGDSNAKISGYTAWLPAVAPGPADNFYGVNRSVDSRLYGPPIRAPASPSRRPSSTPRCWCAARRASRATSSPTTAVSRRSSRPSARAGSTWTGPAKTASSASAASRFRARVGPSSASATATVRRPPASCSR